MPRRLQELRGKVKVNSISKVLIRFRVKVRALKCTKEGRSTSTLCVAGEKIIVS